MHGTFYIHFILINKAASRVVNTNSLRMCVYVRACVRVCRCIVGYVLCEEVDFWVYV